MKRIAEKNLKNNTVEEFCYWILRLAMKLQCTNGERTDKSTNGTEGHPE